MSITPFPKTPNGKNAPEDAEQENLIFLYDEDGQPAAFEFVDTVDRGERSYIVLLPQDGDGETVTIMEMVEDPESEGDYTFYPVENEKTLQSVFRAFRKQNHLDE